MASLKFCNQKVDRIRVSELEKALKHIEQGKGHSTVDSTIHGAIYYQQIKSMILGDRDGNIAFYKFISVSEEQNEIIVPYNDVPHYTLKPNSLEALFPEWKLDKTDYGYLASKAALNKDIKSEFFKDNTITKLQTLLKIAIFELNHHHDLVRLKSPLV